MKPLKGLEPFESCIELKVPSSTLPRIEIWVEKDSIRNFIAKLTAKYRLRIQVLRGFASLSMFRRALERTRIST